MSRWLLRSAVLVTAFVCLAVSRSAGAQDDAQLVIGARTTSEPLVIVWADSAEGTMLDDEAASAMAKQYTSTDWGFFDDSTLLIGKDAQLLPIPVMLYISDGDQTFFLIHRRVGNTSIDGKVLRNPTTKQGQAELYITTPSEDGKIIRTAFLQMPLSFTK